MDYNGFVNSLAVFMGEQDPTNPDFASILPDIINYAEGRMYRDLDMLGNRFRDTSTTTTAGSRLQVLPSQTLVVDAINVLDTLGSRHQLVPTSREFLDWSYPNSTPAGVPIYFAMQGQTAVLLGPWPDQTYQVEVAGVQMATPLSASNITTLLTQFLPETFLTCAMIYASAYQKNYGAQASDPQQASSWEQQYSALMRSAAVWELRKQFISEGWSSSQPNPVAGAAAPGSR